MLLCLGALRWGSADLYRLILDSDARATFLAFRRPPASLPLGSAPVAKGRRQGRRR
jgi:hypothetical protein